MAGTVNGIVAGYDGSPGSQQALDWAAWEARARGLALTVCHVLVADGAEPADGAVGPAWRYAERVVAGGVRHVQGSGGTGDVRPLLLSGRPASVLCEVSGSADMVVLGSRGRGGLAGLLLGSVSSQVAAHGRGVVVVVRGHWRPWRCYITRSAPSRLSTSGKRSPRPAPAVSQRPRT